MKAKLAASKPEKQVGLLRQLIESEWVAASSVSYFKKWNMLHDEY